MATPGRPGVAGESMQTQTPECSVIIPVFNKWELTRDCLASLSRHSTGHDLEVIVVDNGSSDATATELEAHGKSLFGERFVVFVFAENRNFGPACNAGAGIATSPILFFLNNDTILTPEWFPPLLAGLHAVGQNGAVGPLLLYEDGLIQHMGVTFGIHGLSHLYSHFPANHPVVSRKRKLQALTGAAFMIRAESFNGCGCFCEGYKNGFEDIELSVQITRRGGTLRCIPSSRIYHLESKTPGRKDAEVSNSELFTRRCADAVYPDFHHHLLRDGFEFRISELLTLCAKLTEKDDLALREQVQGKDAAEWFKLAQENPFWEHGRDVLAKSCENQKRYAEAVLFRIELTNIFPCIKRYNDLLRLAPLVKDASWQQGAEEELALMVRFKNSPDYTRNVRRRLGFDKDSLLDEAFSATMKEWFS